MCHPPGARPPDVPTDLLPISGGAGGEDIILTSEDATRFRAHLAKAGEGDRGERFASAGVHAIALDYFGRTGGTTRRGDDFEYRGHLAKTKTTTIQADVASAIGHLRGATDARRIYVLGFCMGGRQAFFASAEHVELSGVVGFYGRLSTREGEEGTAPKDRAPRMRAPVLGLFGGADPSIPAGDIEQFDHALRDARVEHHFVTYPAAPHSFFDRTFSEHQEACADAWRRALGFIKTGDVAARA